MDKQERQAIRTALALIEEEAANIRDSNTNPQSGEWGQHEAWKDWKRWCAAADGLRKVLGLKPKKRLEE